MKTAKPFSLRTWSTPLTIGSFVLMAVSGVMMFFDVVPGYVSFAHEWFSWLFLLGAGGHVAVNVRPLAKHLQSGWGRGNIAVFVLVLAISMFSFGRITAPQLKWPIVEALISAPLSALAGVTRTAPADLVEKLKAQGITATPEQNIQAVAESHGLDEFHILGLVILPQER